MCAVFLRKAIYFVFRICNFVTPNRNRCACLRESDRTLRDRSFGWRCPRHFVPGYDRTVLPGQKPFAHRSDQPLVDRSKLTETEYEFELEDEDDLGARRSGEASQPGAKFPCLGSRRIEHSFSFLKSYSSSSSNARTRTRFPPFASRRVSARPLKTLC
jgi:hypothetical protein